MSCYIRAKGCDGRFGETCTRGLFMKLCPTSFGQAAHDCNSMEVDLGHCCNIHVYHDSVIVVPGEQTHLNARNLAHRSESRLVLVSHRRNTHLTMSATYSIEAPFVSITRHRVTSHPFLLPCTPLTPCPPFLPHPHLPPVPILPSFSTLFWRLTIVRLSSHPLLPKLQSCGSPEAILTVLREQTPEFDQSQDNDDGLTEWVTPTVNALYSFSATLGRVVGLVNLL